jgi:hypothetical protein
MLSGSVFDLRDMLRQMRATRTSLEMLELQKRYEGLNVIDCGYVVDIHFLESPLGRFFDNLVVWLHNTPGEAEYPISCDSDLSWRSKLMSHDRSILVAFQGTIIVGRLGIGLRLDDCSLLGVETR